LRITGPEQATSHSPTAAATMPTIRILLRPAAPIALRMSSTVRATIRSRGIPGTFTLRSCRGDHGWPTLAQTDSWAP
jgi:hypothetical protein